MKICYFSHVVKKRVLIKTLVKKPLAGKGERLEKAQPFKILWITFYYLPEASTACPKPTQPKQTPSTFHKIPTSTMLFSSCSAVYLNTVDMHHRHHVKNRWTQRENIIVPNSHQVQKSPTMHQSINLSFLSILLCIRNTLGLTFFVILIICLHV